MLDVGEREDGCPVVIVRIRTQVFIAAPSFLFLLVTVFPVLEILHANQDYSDSESFGNLMSTVILQILPERNEVCVAEERAEKGQQKLPHRRVSLHVAPPDLGQKRLEGK